MRTPLTHVLVPVVLAVAAGCTDPAGDASGPAAAGAETAAVEAPAERDVSGIDVCTAIPVPTFARAVGWPVAGAAAPVEHDPDPSCSYRVQNDGGPSRVDIYLRSVEDYDWALQTANNFGREVIDEAGLGEAAFRKQTLDGWWELWARGADGLVVQTTALDESFARVAAEVALREIS